MIENVTLLVNWIEPFSEWNPWINLNVNHYIFWVNKKFDRISVTRFSEAMNVSIALKDQQNFFWQNDIKNWEDFVSFLLISTLQMLRKIQKDVLSVMHFKGKTKRFAFALTSKECD